MTVTDVKTSDFFEDIADKKDTSENNNIRVLHIIGGGPEAGASKGALSLHKGLTELGLQSKVLIQKANNPEDGVEAFSKQTLASKLMRTAKYKISRLPLYYYRKRKRNVYFSTGLTGVKITRHPLYLWANIINLHWINAAFVSIRELANIGKPVVWTLRDMWPMTGGCHYTMECDGFLSQCGNCPVLASAKTNDMSHYVWRQKRKHLPENINVAAISTWLEQQAAKSSLLGNYTSHTMLNTIDVADFFPEKIEAARQKLGLPQNKHIILAGALRLTSPYKGIELLIEALTRIKNKENTVFVTFGNTSLFLPEDCGIQQINLGYISDNERLRQIYSSADVFAFPSKFEAFGKTLAEALACGTPAVAFAATGPKDILKHQETGYFAKPYDVADFATGLEWILSDPKRAQLMGQHGAEDIRTRFSPLAIARNYKKLYLSCLKH